jgi:hypothetical protein
MLPASLLGFGGCSGAVNRTPHAGPAEAPEFVLRPGGGETAAGRQIAPVNSLLSPNAGEPLADVARSYNVNATTIGRLKGACAF